MTKPKKAKFEISEEALAKLAKGITEASEEMKAAMRAAGANAADAIRCPAREGPTEAFNDGPRCEKLRGHDGEHQYEKPNKPRCEARIGPGYGIQCTKRQGHTGPHL